jgi:hypothetical protein
MTIYNTTPDRQLWKHSSGFVTIVDKSETIGRTAINADQQAYESYGVPLILCAGLSPEGWSKIDTHHGVLGKQIDPDLWDNSSLD